MYSRILVPVDGSHTSTRGLQEAVELAKSQGAALRLMHVVDESVLTMNPEAIVGTGELIDDIVAAGKQALKNAHALAERHGVKAETVMYENLAGRVAPLILDEAKKWRADLIVMGTHGRRGITHAVLGSDAETVVRSSPVPVLLVRAPDAPAKREHATGARQAGSSKKAAAPHH
ncbi:MAG TPA: universal stress protein [Burkholderiales bacterium]|nr:universal stress protein [Burkholderiales bacterium]